jgi:FAD dependent oxidoreductase
MPPEPTELDLVMLGSDGRKVRVGISGSYGGFNLGDEAILEVIIAELRRSLPVEVTVFTRAAEDTRRRHHVDRVVEHRAFLGPLVGVSDDERHRHLEGARQLSLSLLYWMQTEAPRLDGGAGYRGLRLRHDVVATNDGLAKHVYVRESRRIRAEFTVLEQHVGVEARDPLQGAELFEDSVGIGSYRIDLHPSTKQRTYVDISSWPFQIPLGALIPIRVENLLPAGKNIGVTHVTNGCFRLHPVEWSVGEAAGALAAFCLARGVAPRQVHHTESLRQEFQRVLTSVLGTELAWPNPRATAR